MDLYPPAGDPALGPVLDPERRAAIDSARRRGATDLLGWIFACVGLLVLAIGLCWGGYVGSYEWFGESATGTVVERMPHHDADGTTYAITVEYSVDGREYVHSPSGTSNPAPQLGERVTVYHRAGDPRDALVGGWLNWIGPLIMVPIGMIFAAIGVPILFFARRSRARAVAAISTGRRVAAVVESVTRHVTTDSDGDQHILWRLVARYDDPVTRTVHRFQREFDSVPRTVPMAGGPITVFVDERDPSNYSVVVP